MQRLSAKETCVLLILVVSTLAIYNILARADLFRSHIPQMAQARAFVEVVDLPEAPRFRQPDGRYINLGYKFDLLSGGEWVGLLTAQGQAWRPHRYVNEYVPLSDEKRDELLHVAGFASVPAAPPRPWPTLFVDCAASILVLGLLLTLVRSAFKAD